MANKKGGLIVFDPFTHDTQGETRNEMGRNDSVHTGNILGNIHVDPT